MRVEKLVIDREAAREAWRKYQAHKAWSKPHDAEIAAIYKRIGQGHQVIRALESIRVAGMNEKGLPRLAICAAHMTECYFEPWTDRCTFGKRSPSSRDRSGVVRMDWPGLKHSYNQHTATVPLIQIHLRPKRGLQNYHILWEPEWTKTYPVDPYLLRRFGGDAWLVVAAWELTDIERAVMSSRLGH